MTDKTSTSSGQSIGGSSAPSDADNDQLLACKASVEQLHLDLEASGLPDAQIQPLCAAIAGVQSALRSCQLMAGVLLCGELTDVIGQRKIAAPARAAVVSSSLRALSAYLSDVHSNACDRPVRLIWPINDLRAIRNKRLITEAVFSLPDEFSATKSDTLASVLPAPDSQFNADDFYQRFSDILQSLYVGDKQLQDLNQLSELSRGLIDKSSHEYAAIFWFCCSAFVASIKPEPQGLPPGVKHVLRQIDLVIKMFVVDADTPVLSVEGVESVEHIMCSMLCAIALQNPDDPIAIKLELKFEARKSLLQIDALAKQSAQADGIMLESTIQSVYRLIAKTKLAIDAAVEPDAISPAIVLENFACLRDACSIVCSQAALHIEKASSCYNRFVSAGQPLSDWDVCATSLMLAERAMLRQFPQQLSAVSHGDAGLSHSDDALLDESLVKELRNELKLVNNDDLVIDGEASSEWLQAVFLNIASGASFLCDTFLYLELSQLQADVEALLVSSRQSLVLQVLRSVIDYLAVYAQPEKRKVAEEGVHISVIELLNSMKKNETLGVAELVESHSNLLKDVGVDISSALSDTEIEGAFTNTTNASVATEQIVSSSDNEVPQKASVEFGSECNVQVDIIQHALDTALGSSGNLAPDKTVITALDNLQNSVDKAGLVSLLRLIEPLSQILVSAEKAGSTLSQSDTLLVQEAIVAITLGVDSLVNGKPMSVLVADVTDRMTAVAIDGRHQLRGDYESAGLIDIFVEEAEDHLQRLFELFQRWRGAPHGGSRIHNDISRLLHTVKGSADTVGLSTVAALVHHLESALVDVQKESDTSDLSVEFFDTGLDAIEALSDDIDRIRNREQVGDRSDLITRLHGISNPQGSVHGGASSFPALTAQRAPAAPARKAIAGSFEPSQLSSTTGKAPAFGSAKYFNALEVSERLLGRNSGDVLEVHEELRLQVAEMRSTLQSTKYLIANNQQSAAGGLDKSITESLSDLDAVQQSMAKLMGRVATLDERQRLAMKDLSALVATADRVSVDSVRVRMESIVQKSAESLGKQVAFRFHGAELELERKLFSDLVGPLEQLLTNSVVHGIEGRLARIDSDKPNKGVVELSFKIADNKLVVQVSDDGAGIDIAAVRHRLASEPVADLASLANDTEVLQYLVKQGVSTAQRADRASGRGVGLDVVLQQVINHRGEFSVTTAAGFGTEFTITIPLTSVYLQVMVVEVSGHQFALDAATLIDVQEAAEDAVSLSGLLGIADEPVADDFAIVNCRVNGRAVPLKVDAVVGKAALIFNPNDSILGNFPWCGGAALIDGRELVLLLNAEMLHQQSALTPTQSRAQVNINGPSSESKVPHEVLIVDDSVTIRASFGRAMKTAGYGIQLARNGVEALEKLKVSVPAVIILDLEMPEMDGFELAAYIRSQRNMDQTMLLVVSSRPKNEISEWLDMVKAVGYYEKPCTEQALADAVAALL